MKPKFEIRIGADGKIEAKTIGLKGEECLDYLKIFELLLDAKIADSRFTNDYYEVSQHNRIDETIDLLDINSGNEQQRH